jgi:hypothetical protein
MAGVIDKTKTIGQVSREPERDEGILKGQPRVQNPSDAETGCQYQENENGRNSFQFRMEDPVHQFKEDNFPLSKSKRITRV